MKRCHHDLILSLAISSTIFLVACSIKSHEAQYPGETPHSAAPDISTTQSNRALGSSPSYSKQRHNSSPNIDPAPAQGVPHHFGEEHD